MKLLTRGVRACTFTIRLGVAPIRMTYRATRRGVDYAKELGLAIKANLSDRLVAKAAKAFGRKNMISVEAWQ
jgi:hypothetical protein